MTVRDDYRVVFQESIMTRRAGTDGAESRSSRKDDRAYSDTSMADKLWRRVFRWSERRKVP